MDIPAGDSVEKHLLPPDEERGLLTNLRDPVTKRHRFPSAMPHPPHQPSSGAWLGLPPGTDKSVGRSVKYRCILLILLYWGILSSIPQGGSRLADVGTVVPAWIAILELTPALFVPAFLCLAVRTGAQWRELMIAVYAGLALNLLLNLVLPADVSWGDLPAAGLYGTLVWTAENQREWLVTLPRFSMFWSLLIYVFLSGSGTAPLLRLLALAWWALLCLAPINTGLIGYADILGPLLIISVILFGMRLAAKRTS